MIGLDTNILLSLVLNDDPQQVNRAKSPLGTLNESNTGFISVISIVELVWTLRRTFRFGRDEVATTVRTILNAREIVVEDEAIVGAAIDRMQADKVDLADCLIVARNQALGCTRTVTFDRRAAQSVPGMELLT